MPEPSLRALVVDDEKNIRTTLAICLEGLGCETAQAATAEAALAAAHDRPVDLAFADLRLGAASGLDLLPRLLAECPGVAVVVMTAYATIDTAVQAVKGGAADYLPKPFTPDQIRLLVQRVREARATQQRVAELEQALREAVPEADVETRSPAMRAAFDVVARGGGVRRARPAAR
jgi:NtrC-family two-component system response regulator AlgB